MSIQEVVDGGDPIGDRHEMPPALHKHQLLRLSQEIPQGQSPADPPTSFSQRAP